MEKDSLDTVTKWIIGLLIIGFILIISIFLTENLSSGNIYGDPGSNNIINEIIQVDNFLNGSHDIAIGDMDEDGDLDIVADAYVNKSVYWYEQVSSTSWTRHLVDNNLTNAHDIQIVDIDGDGVNDIIGASLSGIWTNYNKENGSLYWYNGSGDTWTRNLIESSNATTDSGNPGLLGLRGISSFDIDSDGIQDVIAAVDGNTYRTKGGLYWFNNPNGTNSSNTSLWNKTIISSVISNLAYAEAGDIDNDGNPDIVTNEHHPENSGMTHIYFAPYDPSNGSKWINTSVLSKNTSWHSDVVDFDGDGYLDVLVTHWRHNKYSWYKNPADDYHWVNIDSEKKFGYLDIENSESLNQSFDEITFEVWFSPLLTNFSGTEDQYSRLISKSPYQLAPDRTNKNILFQYINSTGTIGFITSDVQEWEAGRWYQCIVNINSTDDVIMYIDGIKQANTNTLNGTLNQTNDILRIGDWSTTIPDRAFNGSIGKIKIWNRSLSDSEIAQSTSAGRSQDLILTDNLVFYLSMKGGNDSIIVDLSELGNNATIVGAIRNNSIRNMSAWVETVIDEKKSWTNGSMSIQAYDIDNDGDLDIGVNTIPNIAITTIGYYMWYERTNVAGTSFTRHLIDSNISRTAWAHDLVVDDINNDGYGDLIGASASANKVMLYLINFINIENSAYDAGVSLISNFSSGVLSFAGFFNTLFSAAAIFAVLAIFIALLMLVVSIRKRIKSKGNF